MNTSIIISAVAAFFVVRMLGTIEPGKDGKPVPLRKKVEVYLFTEEQEYYITNPNYTQNKMESFEQLKAYIAQG